MLELTVGMTYTVGIRYMHGGYASLATPRVLANILAGPNFRSGGSRANPGPACVYEVMFPAEDRTKAKSVHGMHDPSNATLTASLPVHVCNTDDLWGNRWWSLYGRLPYRWLYVPAG